MCMRNFLMLVILSWSLPGLQIQAFAQGDNQDLTLRIERPGDDWTCRHHRLPDSSSLNSNEARVTTKSSLMSLGPQRFIYPACSSFRVWLTNFCQPNVCQVALCHGTCAGGKNKQRLQFIHSLHVGECGPHGKCLSSEEEVSAGSPCPLRTFSHILSQSAGCCARQRQ